MDDLKLFWSTALLVIVQPVTNWPFCISVSGSLIFVLHCCQVCSYPGSANAIWWTVWFLILHLVFSAHPLPSTSTAGHQSQMPSNIQILSADHLEAMTCRWLCTVHSTVHNELTTYRVKIHHAQQLTSGSMSIQIESTSWGGSAWCASDMPWWKGVNSADRINADWMCIWGVVLTGLKAKEVWKCNGFLISAICYSGNGCGEEVIMLLSLIAGVLHCSSFLPPTTHLFQKIIIW